MKDANEIYNESVKEGLARPGMISSPFATLVDRHPYMDFLFGFTINAVQFSNNNWNGCAALVNIEYIYFLKTKFFSVEENRVRIQDVKKITLISSSIRLDLNDKSTITISSDADVKSLFFKLNSLVLAYDISKVAVSCKTSSGQIYFDKDKLVIVEGSKSTKLSPASIKEFKISVATKYNDINKMNFSLEEKPKRKVSGSLEFEIDGKTIIVRGLEISQFQNICSYLNSKKVRWCILEDSQMKLWKESYDSIYRDLWNEQDNKKIESDSIKQEKEQAFNQIMETNNKIVWSSLLNENFRDLEKEYRKIVKDYKLEIE